MPFTAVLSSRVVLYRLACFTCMHPVSPLLTCQICFRACLPADRLVARNVFAFCTIRDLWPLCCWNKKNGYIRMMKHKKKGVRLQLLRL